MGSLKNAIAAKNSQIGAVRVARHPHGHRVYLLGLRVHHGPGGMALAGAAFMLHQYRLAAALAVWAASDWRDFPFTDQHNH